MVGVRPAHGHQPLLGPCYSGAVMVDQRPIDVEQHEAHSAGGGHRPMIAERPTVVRRRIRLRDDQAALSRAPQTVPLPGRWELPDMPMTARFEASLRA